MGFATNITMNGASHIVKLGKRKLNMGNGFKTRKMQRKRKQDWEARNKKKKDFLISLTRDELADLYERTKPQWTEFEVMEGEAEKRGADEAWINSRYAVFVYHANNRLNKVQNWSLMLDKENAEKMKKGMPEFYDRYFNPENATGYIHLSIRSRENDHLAHDWRDLMRIKNELVGPDREAVEVYPSMNRIHDTANQFHLWVLPEGEMTPAGWLSAEIVHKHQIEQSTNPFIQKGNQREFEEGFLGEFEEQARVDVDTHPGYTLETVERMKKELEDTEHELQMQSRRKLKWVVSVGHVAAGVAEKSPPPTTGDRSMTAKDAAKKCLKERK